MVLVITLIAGLMPRGNYAENWVTTSNSAAGIDIKQHGFVHGVLPRVKALSSDNYSASLLMEIVANEQLDSTFRLLLFLGDDCNDDPLIVGQWRTHLIVMQGCDFSNRTTRARLNTKLDSVLNETINISVQINSNRGELYLNGVSVSKKNESIYFPAESEHSLLLIGNSPDGFQGWAGKVNSMEFIEHSGTVTNSIDEPIQHRFTFNPSLTNLGFRSDSNTSQTELEIAKVGWFPQRKVLAQSSISSLIEHNTTDVIVNLLGFFPLGFCIAAVLSAYRGLRHLKLFTTAILLGTLVSLSIELLQVFIVGRHSNLHDVLLNGLGAAVGSLIFLLLLKSIDYYKRRAEKNETKNEHSEP